MRGPEPKGIQEPALRPCSLNHLLNTTTLNCPTPILLLHFCYWRCFHDISVAAIVSICYCDVHMLLVFMSHMYRTATMLEIIDQRELPDLIFWAKVGPQSWMTDVYPGR